MRAALLALVLLAACNPPRYRTLPEARTGELAAAVEAAWREAELPPMDLDGVDIRIATDCRTFSAYCPYLRGPGCPERLGPIVAHECAPTDDLVVIAPGETEVGGLAIHGMLHVACDRTDLHVEPGDPRGTDRRHRDTRIWASYGEGTVEARAHERLRP